MPTALAKKLDQLYVSREELRKRRQVDLMKRIVRDCHSLFLRQAAQEFGELFVRRLKRSARRANRSLLGYASDVLIG